MSTRTPPTPLAIDLFCGLGGWTEGLLAEGYDVVGFDIERHVYGAEKYPAQLVLQDVRTIHGAQFKDASLIVASSPCQAYSYMAMPWRRAKQIARALRGKDVFPDGYKGARSIAELNELFEQPGRLQREASEAAGRWIPMVQENVKGAQPWVGPAQWSYGSFFLWGDVPALMPSVVKAQKFNPDGTAHGTGSWFAIADSKNRGARATKNAGGSWFNIAHNTTSGKAQNSDGRPNNARDRVAEAIKVGGDFFGREPGSPSNLYSSKSSARKAASARIAKIPFLLAQHIAAVYHPKNAECAA